MSATPNLDLTAAIEAVAKLLYEEYPTDNWDRLVENASGYADVERRRAEPIVQAAIEAALPYSQVQKDVEIEQIKSVLASIDHFAEVADRVERRNNTLAAERDAALAEVERLQGLAIDQHGEPYRDRFRNQMDAATELLAEVKCLHESEDEYAAINQRMSDLLTRTAIALKGDQPPLTSHDWSDLPSVAKRLRGAVTAVECVLVEVEATTVLHDVIRENPEHRPCESFARAQLATRIRNILDGVNTI